MRGVALPRLLAIGVALAVVTSGCLVLKVPDLLSPPAPGTVDPRQGGPANATNLLRLNVTWKVNDTWVWDLSNGARVTDRVVDVRTIQRIVGERTLTVTRYDVLSREDWGGELVPQWSNHTYEPELGVVNSSGNGIRTGYLRGLDDFRSTPLTLGGPTWFNVSVNYTANGDRLIFDRRNEITNAGQAQVHVPGGTFLAWRIRWNLTEDTGFGSQSFVRTTFRWFDETVRNDVKLIDRGVTWELAGYALDNGTKTRLPGPMGAPPGGWRTGWAWRYVDQTGSVLTRDIVPCNELFAQCRDASGQRLVHEAGKDYLAYRTRTTYGQGSFTLRLTEITLVGPNLAPVATDYYYSSTPVSFIADLNYTGNVPPFPPPPTSRDALYSIKGTSAAGPANHQGQARILVNGTARVNTGLGWLSGPAVKTNVTYVPSHVGGDVFYEEHERVWGLGVRNDASFTLNAGSFVRNFVLEDVFFGETRKPGRDV